MSKSEIIQQLSNLSPQERLEIRAKLNELDELGELGDEWDDDSELTGDEKVLVEQRLADMETNPDASIPWPEAEARLKSRFGE